MGEQTTTQSRVKSEVTEPMDSIGKIIEGIAAKNATMKDGPPEGGSDTTKERPPTSNEEREAAYEEYKEKTRETFDRFTDPNGNIVDPVGLGLEIGQNIVDLGVSLGDDIKDVIGFGVELIGKLKGK